MLYRPCSAHVKKIGWWETNTHHKSGRSELIRHLLNLLLLPLLLDEANNKTDAFANHLQSVYNNTCPGVFFPLYPHYSLDTFCFHSSDLPPVSDSEMQRVTKRLKSPQSVELDGIPGFVTNGCFVTCVPWAKYMRLSQMLLSLWKQAAIVLMQKGKNASISVCRPISLLNKFSKLSKYVSDNHVSTRCKLEVLP